MIKERTLMKSVADTAVEPVGDLLRNVPSVQVESVEYERIVGRHHRVDARVHFSHRGGNYGFVVEVKSDGAFRLVRSGVCQLQSSLARSCVSGEEQDGGRRLIPVIVSPCLSPASRAICLDYNSAYLDLVGNAKIAFDTVYIQRAAKRLVSETRALRSIFAPTAASIHSVLLREPGRAWRVADLATQARPNQGHASNVRKELLAREWIEIGNDGVVLVQPDTLPGTWRRSYLCPVGEAIDEYTHLRGRQLDEQLRCTLNSHPQPPRAIYALHSAAQRLAPFGRIGAQASFIDEPGAKALKDALKRTYAGRARTSC